MPVLLCPGILAVRYDTTGGIVVLARFFFPTPTPICWVHHRHLLVLGSFGGLTAPLQQQHPLPPSRSHIPVYRPVASRPLVDRDRLVVPHVRVGVRPLPAGIAEHEPAVVVVAITASRLAFPEPVAGFRSSVFVLGGPLVVGADGTYDGCVALGADAAREGLGGLPVVPEALLPLNVLRPVAGEA